jgi:aryl-alcohol dehydrogenase-like predicted oxidoreductase
MGAMMEEGMSKGHEDSTVLGPTGLRVGAVGQGTNSWRSDARSAAQLASTFAAALEEGINFFDTAEMYGSGSSEKVLGSCLLRSPGAVVASKFFPMPWRLRQGALLRALRASLARLGLKRLDLYMVHFPTPLVRPESWMAAMAEAAAEGLVGAVGVSNYGPQLLRRAHAELAARGIPLACNEVELNLLSQGAESSGLLELCRQLGVTLIAYRPLALGFLGRGEPEPKEGAPNRRGWRGLMFGRAYARKVASVSGLLREIGSSRGGKTPSQVALNWVICKGALPIPGARSVQHVRENAGAMGWRLAPEEVSALDAAAGRLQEAPSLRS